MNSNKLNKGKRKKKDGGFMPGSKEIYTVDKTMEILCELYTYLWKNENICFFNELLMYAEHAGIEDSITIEYLIYKKYNKNNDIQPYVQKLNKVLEFRCAKTREMYPGITAMALKNKHNWTDKKEVDTNISGLDLKSLLGDTHKEDNE